MFSHLGSCSWSPFPAPTRSPVWAAGREVKGRIPGRHRADTRTAPGVLKSASPDPALGTPGYPESPSRNAYPSSHPWLTFALTVPAPSPLEATFTAQARALADTMVGKAHLTNTWMKATSSLSLSGLSNPRQLSTFTDSCAEPKNFERNLNGKQF